MKRLTLYCDGASRGNPGPAAIGAALFAEDGAELATVSRCLGVATNNEAEYKALIEGAQAASALVDPAQVELLVRMDSQLVVRQIIGQYKVKHAGLRELHKAARSILNEFAKLHMEHIPREQNKRADQLANLALDAGN
ncbi:MAG: ribonuclease HI family protein [Leptospirales bacterium]|nr:ribonuclease HI family protein [Leptospirales bacterium]